LQESARYTFVAVVELKHATAPDVSAKESAIISRKYLEQKIGVRV
jgi:hypothetical protein